jgi:hypothetical protein
MLTLLGSVGSGRYARRPVVPDGVDADPAQVRPLATTLGGKNDG